jgi:hypothetical protein
MRGVDDYLLVKLASSGILRAHKPLLEASINMAGKLALGRQSCHGVNVGSAVAYQVARFGPPSGLPHTRHGGRDPASLHCFADRGAIAGWGAMDA